MFTLLYNPYLVNWFTREEGGVKTGQNPVHVVCEEPLIIHLNIQQHSLIVQRFSVSLFRKKEVYV